MNKDDFKITGLFYSISGIKCRKYLDIVRIDSLIEEPDLMVIMMNPGSSSPVDGIDDNSNEAVANPDKTQDQIMSLMNNCDFKFVRVLNLSDIREAKSKVLYKLIKEESIKNIPHSIFNSKRKADLIKLFNSSVPVVLGWGVDSALKKLALNALQKIKYQQIYGWKIEGCDFGYYHPLPPIHQKQKEWLEKVSKQINVLKN